MYFNRKGGPMKLVLGSESEFRKKLMEDAGYEFVCVPSFIDEKSIRKDDPKELVLALGHAKAVKVATGFRRGDDVLIIASDQVVVRLSDQLEIIEVLEKPLDAQGYKDRDLAWSMLDSYRNGYVQTITSLVLLNMQNTASWSRVDTCRVELEPFSLKEMDEMVEDPYVYKACGALPYGVPESIAADIIGKHIKKFHGDPTSFIGLPMTALRQSLSALGYYRAQVA